MTLVLIVEDEETLRRVQAKYLRRVGYEVREAATGPAGVAAALQDPVPDAIVMDIMLPQMDGVAATLALRRDPRMAAVPVVASTGAVLGPLPMEQANFAAVLQKPYDLSVLVKTLREVLPEG